MAVNDKLLRNVPKAPSLQHSEPATDWNAAGLTPLAAPPDR